MEYGGRNSRRGRKERRMGGKCRIRSKRKKEEDNLVSTAYLVKRNILGFSLSIYGEGLTQLWTLVSPASGERNSFA